MTHFPGDGVMPPDDTSAEEHATEMVTYYRSLTDSPGDIFLPAHPHNASKDWTNYAIGELGATWLYTAKIEGQWRIDMDRIAQGPTPD